MRSAILLSMVVLMWGRVPAQQPASAAPAFAVATIRPSPSDAITVVQFRGNRFATEGTTLVDLFKYAYNVHPAQVVGGPEWIRTEKFNILADPETEKRPSSDAMKAMVQQLLADRFHLRMHREQKVLPVYALVKTPDEPKLTRTTADPGGIPTAAYSPKGRLEVGNATMADFAAFLQRFVLDRPAVDQTGIPGRFDLSLRWTPDELAAGAKPDEPQAAASVLPSLFTAIQEELGVKLQPAKAATEVFVIDRVEHPSEN